MKTVLDLKKGESGYVKSFRDAGYACKLLTLGMVPLSKVTLVRKSPFGGSLYIKMNKQYIAIRRSEAEAILLEA